MELTERLLELVKQYPILYNTAHDDYKNCRKRDEVWDEIGLELNESGEEVKRKWKNLRDTYAKHLKSLKAKAGQKKNYAKWQWAKHMEPFSPYLAFVRKIEQQADDDHSESNSTMDPIHCDVPQNDPDFDTLDSKLSIKHIPITPVAISVDPLLTTTSVTPAKTRKRTKAKQDSGQEATPQEDPAENCSNKRPCGGPNPIDLIFSGYAQIVQNFSPKRQAITKLKVAEIIMEQELLNQEELTGNRQGQLRHTKS